MQRVTIVRALALVALLVLGAACNGEEPTTPAPPVDPPPEETEDVFSIATVDNNFAPSTLDVPAGQEITVEVQNNGQNPHTFTITELGVDTEIIPAGESAEATLTVPDEPAEIVCMVHAEMRGTLQPG